MCVGSPFLLWGGADLLGFGRCRCNFGLWTVLLLSLLGRNRFEGEWLVPIEQLCAPVEMGTHEDFVFRVWAVGYFL